MGRKRSTRAADAKAKAADKPVQTRIPGTEPKKIAEVEKAAKQYRQDRDARMELLADEVESRAKLMEAMTKHGLTEYKYDDQEVRIVEGETKVKVRTVKSGTEGDLG